MSLTPDPGDDETHLHQELDRYLQGEISFHRFVEELRSVVDDDDLYFEETSE